MRRLLLFLLLLAWPLSVASAGERILAISPHVCEILAAVGAADEIVGISDYCDYPAALADYPVVANHSRVFIEAALRLQPTLAVVHNGALPGLEALRAQGCRVIVSHPRRLEDIFADIERLGSLTGHGAEAEGVARTLRARLAAIEANDHRPRVFFEVWSDPLMGEGGKSFINEVLRVAGGDNAFAEVEAESMRLGVEAVVRANPEIIVIPAYNGNIDDRRAFWREWLPAARVVSVHPDIVNRPGPRIVEGIEALNRLFRGRQ